MIGYPYLRLNIDYNYVSNRDADTDITGAELEELSDSSETTLHSHAGNGNGVTDHSELSNLDYASAAHTGFEPTVTKGNLTETTSNVLTITGGTGAVIGSGATIQVTQASSGTSGYLFGTDWDTFNSKQAGDAGLTSLAGLTYVSASFVKMTGANTFALRTIGETADDLEGTIVHDNLSGFDANEHFLQSAITQVGTIATGVWEGTSISTTYTDAKCTDATADNTASNETSHSDVLVDGDFTSNGLMERTGAGTYGIKVIGTDVQAYDAGLDSLSGLTYASDSFIKVTATDTYAIRTIAETKTDLSLNLVENTALSTWAGTTNVTTLGTIATGTWEATDVGIAHGGTGQSTQQAAIDALTNVSAATNEHVLTKDTASGNAIWKAATGGGSSLSSSGATVFNTTLTAAGTFQDLDLSGTVGSNIAVVFLEVKSDASATYVAKPKGYGDATFANHWNTNGESFGCSVGHFDGATEYEYLCVFTDSSGVIQHACGNNTTTFTIKLIGYIA